MDLASRQDTPGGCTFMRTIVFIDGQNLYHLAKTAWIATPAVSPHASASALS